MRDAPFCEHLQAFALDALAIGVIVTDRSAHVVYANEAARRIAATPSSALRLRGGKISGTRAVEHASLAALIAWACGSGACADSGCDYLLAPACDGDAPDLSICVMPMEGAANGDHDPKALLLVRTIAVETNLEVEARRLFGLTKSEARFASALASGLSLSEAATLYAVSQQTARTHMKSIFRKTGVGRQSQVAALLRGVEIPVRPCTAAKARETPSALSA